PGHVYYRNDHVGGGHVSQTNIAVTTATDDRTLADFDPDPDWPHSWWSIQLHGFQRADTVFITDTVVLDGYTQPGASPNTLAVGDNAVLKIVLDGAQGLVGENGVTIRGGGCTVRGLVFNHFLDTALNLHGSGNNLVVGNFIGTDVSGTSAAGGYDPGGGLGMWTTSPG